MKPTLFLCGAGNAEGVRLALRINEHRRRWESIVIVDDDVSKHGKSILGIEIVGSFDLLGRPGKNGAEVANLVARTTAKRRLAREKILKYGLPFVPLIDGSVDILGVDYNADIIVYQNAIFSAGAFVDESSVVFTGAIVGHGCRMGKGCIIAPGAVINARVKLGEGVYVGTNASILPDVTVGSWATIGVNSAVVEDIPDGATVMGVPAQLMVAPGEKQQRTVVIPSRKSPGAKESLTRTSASVEKALAKIWSQVLGIEKVGIHDNFFDLGGDSILAIQIIGKANQAGMQLTVRQLLDHQTIAELATVIGEVEMVSSTTESVTGSLFLTPIQKWFLEQDVVDAHHYNQTMLLKVPAWTNLDLLEKALGEIMRHHDMLRARFSKTAGEWQQVCCESTAAVPFFRVDLSGHAEEEKETALGAAVSHYQARLHLAEGPIAHFVHFRLGDDIPGRLLLVIHHLAVDGISWRILLEDLQTAYGQLGEGRNVTLPPRTTSFQQWGKSLREYAKSTSLVSEVDYWLARQRRDVLPLPRDFPDGANTEGSTQVLVMCLTPQETNSLLQEVPAAYNTRINDVLLTALAMAFSRWTGTTRLLTDLEGHGREEIVEGVDISRTIGWFTSLFPVLLEVKSDSSVSDAVRAIRSQLQDIPHHGIGYGVLRYMRDDRRLTAQLKEFPQAEVQFNYLGQFDQMFTGSSLFVPAPEPPGAFSREASPSQQRPYLLEILGMVVNGTFSVKWLFSENIHKQSTIEGLAEDFMTALRTLIGEGVKRREQGPAHSEEKPHGSRDRSSRPATGVIRPMISDDIPRIVDLHTRLFPWSAHVPPGVQAARFEHICFHNPWYDSEMPSLVYEDVRGKIVGFLGVLPRRMKYQDTQVRAAFSYRFMVDPDAQSPLASFGLLQRFLSGPQDLSIADGANDLSRKVWEGVGGVTSPIYSIEWRKPLRPTSFLAHLLGKKKWLAPVAWAAMPIARLVDSVAVRLPVESIRRSPGVTVEEELDAETLIRCIDTFTPARSLRPDYDAESLQWLFDFIGRSGVFGTLRKTVVRDGNGTTIGWYIFYKNPGGKSEVLQIGATEHTAPQVLRSLFYSAWRCGAIECSGRLEPRFMSEFTRELCLFQPGRTWMLVHSRKPELKEVLMTGETSLSRLDGEPFWLM